MQIEPDGTLTAAMALAELEQVLTWAKRPHSIEMTTAPLRNDAGKMRRYALWANRYTAPESR